MQGHEKSAERLIRETLWNESGRALGQGVGLNMMLSARAVPLQRPRSVRGCPGSKPRQGRPPNRLELGPTKWALAELVEAGVRSGNADEARQRLRAALDDGPGPAAPN